MLLSIIIPQEKRKVNACGEKFIFQRETLNRENWKGKEKIVSQVILNLRTLKFTTLIELLVIKNRIQTKYITWLSLHGLAKIGTLQELRMRINKFQLYPSLTKKLSYNVMRCAIWYYLHNLKKVKNTHGGVLILVKLQASACNTHTHHK